MENGTRRKKPLQNSSPSAYKIRLNDTQSQSQPYIEIRRRGKKRMNEKKTKTE